MSDPQDKDLSAIGDTFKGSIAHMKNGFPAWEEFVARGMKFQKHMEQTIVSFNAFVDGIYKIAEVATNKKGATHEIGTGLTNLAMWHRGQEMKLREMNQALMAKLLAPLQIKVEEWKRTTSALERDHDKELQKSVKDIKDAAKHTMKTSKNLDSKLKKDKSFDKTGALHYQLEHYQQETDRLIKETEDKERKNLNRVLLEERSWFCGFVNAFTRVLDVELGMLADIERLQAILKDLSNEVSRPAQLPDSTREMLENWSIPASPAIGRKRISNAPSMLSVSSSSSGDSGGPVISGPVITAPVSANHIPINPSLGAGNFTPPPGNFTPPPPPPVAPPISAPSVISPPPPTVPQVPQSSHSSYAQTRMQYYSQTLPRSHGSSHHGQQVGEGVGGMVNSNLQQGFLAPQHVVPHGGGGGGGAPFNANGYQNRSLPPVEDNYELISPPTSAMSVSPSQASLMSSQSAESSRSLSPPNPQSNGYPGANAEPPSFQQQLMSKIRLRSCSIEGSAGIHSTGIQSAGKYEDVCPLTSSHPTPPMQRAFSIGSKAMPPPVSSKPSRPPAVASKPARPGSSTAANGHRVHATHPSSQSFDTSWSTHARNQPQAPDSDDEEDNMFAKALRQRKLKSVQTNDRSNPHIGR